MAAAVVHKVYGNKVQSMLVCKGQRPYISIAVAAHKVDVPVAILYVAVVLHSLSLYKHRFAVL